jgi:hypothetical protein
MSVLHGQVKATIVIAGTCARCIGASLVINCDVRETLIEKVLAPELCAGYAEVMDNLSNHKGPRVQAVIQAAGRRFGLILEYGMASRL